MSHVVRGDDMFPLDTLRALETFAVGIVAWLKIATTEIDRFFVFVFAPAVECLLQVPIVNFVELATGIAVVEVPFFGLIDFGVCQGAKQNHQGCGEGNLMKRI